MTKNVYDKKEFFDKYAQMSRSKEGLSAAGEWHELQKMLPNLQGKTMLDLGCGYGWHCRYAVEEGAASVFGIDGSEKMIEKAEALTDDSKITYKVMNIEDIDLLDQTYDLILSSLVIHYIQDFESLAQKIFDRLNTGGKFVFSVEHPIFTAEGKEEWITNDKKENLYWPVDNYFFEREIVANFLGEDVIKHHRTMTTYINTLLKIGFKLDAIVEPKPADKLLDVPGMRDELRRPMMLLISVTK